MSPNQGKRSKKDIAVPSTVCRSYIVYRKIIGHNQPWFCSRSIGRTFFPPKGAEMLLHEQMCQRAKTSTQPLGYISPLTVKEACCLRVSVETVKRKRRGPHDCPLTILIPAAMSTMTTSPGIKGSAGEKMKVSLSVAIVIAPLWSPLICPLLPLCVGKFLLPLKEARPPGRTMISVS